MLKSQAINPDLFGRSQVLEHIHEILLPSRQESAPYGTSSLRSLVLCGFGGLGKTQIAVQFAHSVADQYDAVFWVQADGAEKIADSFREMAVELQLINAADAPDPVVTRKVVMEWLSIPLKSFVASSEDTSNMAQEMAKWLVIFDNADKPEILRDYWPISGNGSALVTSRDPPAKTYLHPTRGIDLLPFGREDAASFLEILTAKDATSQSDHEIALELSDRLGGFPLALVHIASIVQRMHLTLVEMLEKYEKRLLHSELYDARRISPHDKYAHTLATVWAVEDLGKSSIHLLNLIALFDPDAIPETILQIGLDPSPSDDHYGRRNSYEEARTSLISASLVKRDTEKKQIIVHRVVQEGTRNRMSPERLKPVFNLVVGLLLNAWYHDPEEKFTHVNSLWELAKSISPHATYVHALYEQYQLQLDPDEAFAFARLLQKNGW